MTGLTHRAHAHHAVAFGHGVAACDCVVLLADALTSGAAGAAHVPVRKGNGRAGRMFFFFFPTFFFSNTRPRFRSHASPLLSGSQWLFLKRAHTAPPRLKKKKKKKFGGFFFWNTHAGRTRTTTTPLSCVFLLYCIHTVPTRTGTKPVQYPIPHWSERGLKQKGTEESTGS